jgi:hypothetical protein
MRTGFQTKLIALVTKRVTQVTKRVASVTKRIASVTKRVALVTKLVTNRFGQVRHRHQPTGPQITRNPSLYA